MKTCSRCLQDKPLSEFRRTDRRRPKVGYSNQCRECDNKTSRERYGAKLFFETLGPSDLWPKGRIFTKNEFMGCMDEGIWPPGLVVKNEKGVEYEVVLSLKRREK